MIFYSGRYLDRNIVFIKLMADILGVPREAMEPLEATVALIGFALLMWSVWEMKKKEMINLI